jgi:S-adenosylmethionine synthetase
LCSVGRAEKTTGKLCNNLDGWPNSADIPVDLMLPAGRRFQYIGLKLCLGGNVANGDFLFTSESVSEGHPDKVSDRISDEVVDLFLGADPLARVGCETLCTTNRVIVAGEVRGPSSLFREDGSVDSDKIEELARNAIREIGYEQSGFHWRDLQFECLLHGQSVDIAQGVDAAGNKDEGAGDQGLMFGYACRETTALMPAAIHYSHEILRRLAQARHSGAIRGLGPDSKSQVTLEYVGGKPVRATSIVVSTQHDEDLDQAAVREIVRPFVEQVLPAGWMCPEDEFYVNPTGRFVIGGPDSDVGLTGRKIIVDTYGGAAPHGGGAFSGKDPSKVDRSAAYAARYVAKNVVAAGLAERCTIQVAYAIGISKPLSVYVDTQGTGTVDDTKLTGAIQEALDLSPRNIREHLKLSRPIYVPTSAYGHFGRKPREDGSFSWERTDLVEALKAALS